LSGHRKFNEIYPVKNGLFYRELIYDDDWNELTREDAETILENPFSFAPVKSGYSRIIEESYLSLKYRV